MARFDIEIKKITVEEENKLMNGKSIKSTYGNEKFIKFGVNSQKAAELLNRMLVWKYESCNDKRRYWNNSDVDRVVGGGLLVKAAGNIVITQTGEVGILFEHGGRINNFIRVASGEFETIKAIKDRVANELKKFWNAYSKNCNDEMQIGEYKFSTPDFRVLYEVLKGRDEKKIKAKYGTAIYNEMIGKKIDDQFILTAIETIKNEIAKTIEEKRIASENRRKKYETERELVYMSWKSDLNLIETEANQKIAVYEEQIKMMMNGVFA